MGLDPDALRRAFPDATPRLAVFLHGLCETDDAWRLRAARHVPYGERLRTELGYTPIFIRYNSGLHISHNGRALAALLDALTEHWPVAGRRAGADRPLDGRPRRQGRLPLRG